VKQNLSEVNIDFRLTLTTSSVESSKIIFGTFKIKNSIVQLGVVVHACNPSTQEAKEGGS
jgi:hypothetical protein